jgi:hypothetical protein
MRFCASSPSASLAQQGLVEILADIALRHHGKLFALDEIASPDLRKIAL